MRVAIVSQYIATSDSTEFYQSQQVNLARELSHLGLEVDIITAKRLPNDPDEERLNEKTTIYRLPVIARWTERFLNQLLVVRLWRQLDQGQYTFIQSSDDCIFSTLSAAVYALLKGSRLIIYQGIYEYSKRKLVKTFMVFYDLIAGIILRQACWVAVCKTRRASEYLQKKGFRNTKVIPVGVDTTVFYPQPRKAKSNIELLAVGNLIPLKNYPLILETFSRLLAMDPNVRLTIIGSGPEKEWILNIAWQNDLSGTLRLIEKVPNLQMREYYCQSDMLLLFSHTEIFGMVMLEAMACGCPVMATPTPGAVDVIVDGINGFIIKDTDPSAIATVIRDVLADSDLIDGVRCEATRVAHERYAWPIIAHQYYNLYEMVADGKG